MAKRATRHTPTVSLPTILDPRHSQLVYASRAVFVGNVEFDAAKCLAVRSDIMDSFPDFSSSAPRSETEYKLRRSGRSGADEEYLLTLTPQAITVAAGKSIKAKTFADLYMKVWSSIADHLEIGSDALSQFDINLTWDIKTQGNPYLKSIIPALTSKSLAFVRDLFVFQFDQEIRFQRQAGLTEPVFFLEIGSPHDYQDISGLAKTDGSNDIRVKLGIGLTNDCLGGRSEGLAEVASEHWEDVVSELEQGLYDGLIEPVLASLETGTPTTRTATAKEPSKGRQPLSKTGKRLSKRSQPSGTGRKRQKRTGRA